MLYRYSPKHRSFLHAALLAALVFLWPSGASAIRVPVSATLQSESFVEVLLPEEISSWYAYARAFGVRPDRFREIESAETSCTKHFLFCQALLSRATRSHIVLTHTVSLVPAALDASIQDFADKANREPVNARLSAKDGKISVVKEAENGILVNESKSREILEQALEENVSDNVTATLVSENAPAKVSSATLDSLGIKELIGSGTSDFRGSPKNRVYNINRSLEQFQSVIVMAGEEFSFVEYLGEVDEAHGYLPELVIKDNKTQPEFGGGVCQVSSTIFRAAIYSGMKITERRNHSYPVQYYLPYGMDATIYIPKPDFKFRNNTGSAIMMQSVIEGTKLTFQFFGTKDGREVSVDGPYILERNPDGSMKTTFTQIMKDASGVEIIKDEFKSSYKSPSLFPHPGDEIFTSKPKGWSERQWREYKAIRP